MKLVIIFFFTITFLIGCKPSADQSANYKAEIDAWHRKRGEALVGPSGWLNVSGLFWLKDGINSFGSDKQNDVVFPEGKIARKAGFFILKDSIVSMEVFPDVEVLSDSVRVTSRVIFHPDSLEPKELQAGVLQWFVIKRNDKIGIRLRDLENKNIENFNGIERFETDLKWRVTAKLTIQPGRKIIMANVLGQNEFIPIKGTLTFSLDGNEYQIDAIDENGKLFIIFGDLTNNKSTYGSGRYLYATIPENGDEVTLDFNKAYNPPCAFTEFATCLLPTKQNTLPVEVLAGEKLYH